MSKFKSKFDDLFAELERCRASQQFEAADNIRAKIHKLIEDRVKEMNHEIDRRRIDEPNL